MPRRGPTRAPVAREYLLEVAGWLYLALSLSLSVYAIDLFAPYMENGLFWPHFDALNTLGLLGAVLNQHLGTLHSGSNPVPIDLLAPSASIWQLASMGVNPAYPRLLLYQELTDLAVAIPGLRRLDPSAVSFMITPYCWVDLQRRYVLAHTPRRLERCVSTDVDNGAVYLEAVLRNIDVDAWNIASGGAFATKIASSITASSAEGASWVDAMYHHTLLAIDDERAYWEARGLGRFQLQYGNRVQLGINENVAIMNALGITYDLPVTSIRALRRGASWTTSYMYQSLGNDLNAIWPNQSLVVNTATYFGWEDMDELVAYDVGMPLNAVNQVITLSLGPLNSIDLRWLRVPPRLADAVSQFDAQLYDLVANNATLYEALASLPLLNAVVVPYKWQDPSLRFVSGNLMCSNGAPMPFVLRAFGFDDACGTQVPAEFPLSAMNTLFALHMVDGQLDDICAQVPTQVALCERLLPHLTYVYRLLAPFLSHIDHVSLHELQLAKVQVVLNGSALSLQTVLLLGERFDFFGYINVYDWAHNIREALAFEGDVRTLHLVSYAYTPLSPPSIGIRTNTNVGKYLWITSSVVTGVLGAIGCLCLLLVCRHRPRPGTTPWFLFSRLVSSVWLNRTLLGVRAMTALLCLSTAPLVPMVVHSDVWQLQWQPRSMLASAVLASEASWLTYVAYEVLHPLTSGYTHHAAMGSAVITWGMVLLVDAWAPVKVAASVHRRCDLFNMDWQLECCSASVRIGSFDQLVSLVLLQLFGVFVGYVVAVCVKRCRRHRPTVAPLQRPPSLLLQGSVHAFGANTTPTLNFAASAMAGLFLTTWDGAYCVFDINRWMYLPLEVVQESVPFMGRHLTVFTTIVSSAFGSMPALHRVSNATPVTLSTSLEVFAACASQRFWHLVGFLYVMGTLSSNIAYFNVVLTSLSNDYGWAGYNSSGMQPFLANVFNRQLLLASSLEQRSPLMLDDPGLGDTSQLYNGSSTVITWSDGAARRQLYASSRLLTEVVMDLRNMDPCALPWMSTQYCWLDVRRIWSMASTLHRQARCETSAMRTNGAVYLETGLRNLNDWDVWMRCWGTSFEIGFQRHLETSLEGREWLTTVPSAMVHTSIPDEVDFWQKHGISTYQLQWQNYKSLGMIDTITIVSALGLSYPLLLSQSDGAYHCQQQTSYKLYWTFASDLWAITPNATQISASSLLRASAAFAFANVTRAALLVDNTTLLSPLNPGFTLLDASMGPFGAIDSYYVPCPSSLLWFYTVVSQRITRLVAEDASAAAAYSVLSAPPWYAPVPHHLLHATTIQFTGGNVLCGTDTKPWLPENGLYLGYSVTNMCNAVFSDRLELSLLQKLVVLAAMNASVSDMNTTAICALDTRTPANCTARHAGTLNFLSSVGASVVDASLPLLVTDAMRAVDALDVILVQFLLDTNSNVTSLARLPLLNASDAAWTFYGWCYLVEWVVGHRDVVAFHGDLGNLTVLSAATGPIEVRPDPNGIPQSFSFLCLLCVQYVTCTLIGVSVLVALSTLYHRGYIESFNLLCINRVVGLVWVGRPIILLRSLTAIWLLNTSPLPLLHQNGVTFVKAPPLDSYKALLATSELTWFVYVLNDVGSALTRQYTYSYGSVSANWTWVLASLWTLLSPQPYDASMQRKCAALNMDFALYCDSGTIVLGDQRRCLECMGLALVACVVCYLYARRSSPNLTPIFTPPLLLNAQGYHMLTFKHWVANGVYYIDTTSAIMAGVLSWKGQGHIYLLDIKTWRFVSTALPTPRPQSRAAKEERFAHAFPLHL
ncbi:hypothetical protein SDRG_07042 [Saprolegnia diclina VS20]|uniref:Uncharacterized protein n=1 Tax=Saprolegnia diclina (strain VS20) TaxID=1156394 RepID=T0QNC4_SAPDV|nr:hypothetical protein SDRG_07042 [Saprolegnia diclina VS20]EQC35330.1 hypothetical protein SDRG_07042 [Saprolegnia diclina VS20]|eukprot:XP_008611080.1 hypothetical protein SDRG_07042 [Saprolegnia diclina VS20]